MIIDTNALSAWADGLESVRPALESAASLIVPVIVLGEFRFGIRQSRYQKSYESWLARRIPLAMVVGIEPNLAGIYADLRLVLKAQGTPFPQNDVWIAALVLRLNEPLLSNDHHFDHIPGLKRIAF